MAGAGRQGRQSGRGAARTSFLPGAPGQVAAHLRRGDYFINADVSGGWRVRRDAAGELVYALGVARAARRPAHAQNT